MPNRKYYGLILAGGRGTRFWPRSRRRCSKQVLNVVGKRSLIQATVDRLKPVIPPERIWILTNDYLRDEIVCQLPEVPPAQIQAEPVQRNTAPAIGLAAQVIHSLDPDALMGVFPSDHLVANRVRFRQLVRAAFRAAEQRQVVVLGLQPRWPETGYGYIEFPRGIRAGSLEAAPVLRFREKPELPTARRFVSAGRFFWNSGMFFWRTDVLLEELRKHLPKTASLLAALPRFSNHNFRSRLMEIFPLCENISIDYAVLEKSDRVVGLACDDIGWSDLGSWNAIYELLPRDCDGNAISTQAICCESRGNYVDASSKMVALLGVENLIVVDTPDALLIANRKHAQRVSEVVKTLEKLKREDLL